MAKKRRNNRGRKVDPNKPPLPISAKQRAKIHGKLAEELVEKYIDFHFGDRNDIIVMNYREDWMRMNHQRFRDAWKLGEETAKQAIYATQQYRSRRAQSRAIASAAATAATSRL